MERVTVRWIDSASSPGWKRANEKDWGLIECETTGYLLERTSKYIAIAQNRGVTTGGVGDVMCIPTSCVLKTRKIR